MFGIGAQELMIIFLIVLLLFGANRIPEIARGLGKISVNEMAMLAELQEHPEVLAEAIQTVLRREGAKVPYEKLKDLTRGRKVSLEDFAAFIDGLDVSADVKKRLKKLRPENYLGLAEDIAKQ